MKFPAIRIIFPKRVIQWNLHYIAGHLETRHLVFYREIVFSLEVQNVLSSDNLSKKSIIYMEVFLLCPLYEMSIRDVLLLLFLKVSYVIHFRPISIARELYLTSLKQNS